MSLEGFEAISFGNAGLTVSITKNGTTFNKTVVEKLSRAPSVVLMINRGSKQFAIRTANTKANMTMPFYTGAQKSASVRWNSKEFLRTLSDLAGWDLANTQGYHINGTYLSSDKAVLFDLNDAIPN